MAKLSSEENDALAAGYAEGERVKLAGGKAKYANPWLWSSRLWEAFEFGYYIHEKGLVLRNYERGRGNTFRNDDGGSFKLWYTKQSFGIIREA
jgi:hypothetical protein